MVGDGDDSTRSFLFCGHPHHAFDERRKLPETPSVDLWRDLSTKSTNDVCTRRPATK